MLVLTVVGLKCYVYAGRVECCPLVSHGEYATGQPDGRTPDRYITRSVMDATSVTKHQTCFP